MVSWGRDVFVPDIRFLALVLGCRGKTDGIQSDTGASGCLSSAEAA